MSLPKLIQYVGPARANDGRLPVTEQANGQVGLSTKGSRGPFVANGVAGQGQLFKGFTDADATLTPAQVIGAHIGFPVLGAARTLTLPTAEEILSFIGPDLCAPPAAVPDPVTGTTNAGASYLGVTFPFTISFTSAANSVQFGASTGVVYHAGGNPLVTGTSTLGPLNTWPAVAKFKIVIENANAGQTPSVAAVAVYRDY